MEIDQRERFEPISWRKLYWALDLGFRIAPELALPKPRVSTATIFFIEQYLSQWALRGRQLARSMLSFGAKLR